MVDTYLLRSVVPFLILIGFAVLLKAWLARPSGPTLDVRPAPLMTNVERRTIAYIESALPWARIHAQVSMGAILAPKKGLNRSQATTVRNRFSSPFYCVPPGLQRLTPAWWLPRVESRPCCHHAGFRIARMMVRQRPSQ